jgi:hypothetical protein
MDQGTGSAIGTSAAELLRLSAVDTRLFNRTFFPRAFRSPEPIFADAVDDLLESHARLVNLQLFRGSSKTTRVRANVGKRIAFGTTKVTLLVGASYTKAEQSVGWLKRLIDKPGPWATFFQLTQGDVWQEGLVHIKNGLFNTETWVLAFGITGKHRGVNIDDFRPDFIAVDDIIDEEVAASPEQRKKASDLVHGSLYNSLVPRSENPQSKIVMMQTPFNNEDPSMRALKDPRWVSYSQGCWTKETAHLPLEYQMSVWEERFPSHDLRQDKLAAIGNNEASIFAREMECRIVTAETSMFKSEWLRHWTNPYELPERLWITGGIDPVPPPSPLQIAQGFLKKDFEVLALVGYSSPNVYLLEYVMNRGHDPNWTINEFFSMLGRWKSVKQFNIEAIAYQRTLAWLLSQEMQKRRKYCVLNPVTDKRRKPDRINDSMAGLASEGKLYVHPSHTDFISQFNDYPNVAHDDVLDAVSMAIDASTTIELGEDDWSEVPGESKNSPDRQLTYVRGAP